MYYTLHKKLRLIKNRLKLGRYRWCREYQLIGEIFRGEYPSPSLHIELSWVEKAFMILLVFVRSLSLVHIRGVLLSDKWRSEFTELYVVFWLVVVLPLLLLFYPAFGVVSLIVVVGYRLVGAVNYPLCIIFVDTYSPKWRLRSLNRTLVLLILNYFEIIIGFASVYLRTQSIGYAGSLKPIVSRIEALYFSTVTITTLGYGDLQPISSLGRILAMVETIMGILLLVLVVSTFLRGISIMRHKRQE